MHGQFSYQDFDLLIEPGPPGSYRARVLRSPAGESAAVQFMLPFSPVELENFVLKVGRGRRRARGPGRPESAPLKEFGGKLYGAVFQDELRDALHRSLGQTRPQGLGLRLRLRLADTPELAEVPWEFLFDPRHNRFLAQSRYTPLVRYLDLPDPPRPLSVEGPLRLLVMVSSPSGYAELDVEHEWDVLTGALAQQLTAGRVIAERLVANMNTLRRRLRREEFHIFHFIGHGRYRSDWGDGVLVMEDRNGQPQEVTGEELGSLLSEYDQTRLAVLNACEGARSDASDPFAGMAQSLIQQGLPAVVAMQFEITDRAAIIFAREFYGAITDGYPLEAALAESRGAIRDEGIVAEWGTPVLYSRAPDGHLFDLTRQDLISEAERQVPAEAERRDLQKVTDDSALAAAGQGMGRSPTASPPVKPPALALRYAVRSDVGLIPVENEDSAYAGPRLLAVADGTDDPVTGAVASALTIASIAELDSGQPGGDMLTALSSAVTTANARLREMITSDPAVEDTGTTLTALLWSDGHAAVCHIGDSRCYLLREGELYQITHDHTLVQSLVDEGRISADDVSAHPQRSLLLRALDGRSIADPDLSVHDGLPCDRYLLCSDGLSDVVSDETLRDTLSTIEDPEVATRQLIELAIHGGGPDNITCIVADVVDTATTRLPPITTPVLAGAAANVGDLPMAADHTDIPRRPLHLIILADCSGGMKGEKINALNYAIVNVMNHLAAWERDQDQAQVLVRAIAFATTPWWHMPDPQPVTELRWKLLKAVPGGLTNMGPAFALAAEALAPGQIEHHALRSAMLLITDGLPTDPPGDFEAGLASLMAQPAGKAALRLSIAIGRDAQSEALVRFIGDPSVPVLVAGSTEDIVDRLEAASRAVREQVPGARTSRHPDRPR